MEDLETYFAAGGSDDMLLNGIKKNTKRYIQLFSDAADTILDSIATSNPN